MFRGDVHSVYVSIEIALILQSWQQLVGPFGERLDCSRRAAHRDERLLQLHLPGAHIQKLTVAMLCIEKLD